MATSWELRLVGGAVAAVVFLVALLQLLLSRRRAKDVFPPGPPGWPVIGHWPLLRWGSPREKLVDLSRNHGYGPIIGLRLGSRPTVVVCSAHFAKELLVTHDRVFANRPHFHFVDTLFYGFDSAIIFSNYGSTFSRARKICSLELLSAKRLQELQYIRQEEISSLLDRLRRLSASSPQGHAVNVEHMIADMSCDITMRLLHSRSAADSSPNLSKLVRDLEKESAPTLGDFVPWLRWLHLLQLGKWKRVHQKLDKVIESMISDRKQLMKTTPPHELPLDFLQVLLSKETVEDEEQHLTTTQIKAIILDIFSGGFHTSSVSVEWAMSELIGNPRVLQKVRDEMDALKGKGKDMVTDEDIANLPYLVSVVKEVFRLRPPVPLLVARISKEACKIGKYTLPKGTQAFINVWGIARDPELWGDKADEFYPERFEGNMENVDVRGINYELLPFGGGRRICPGMRLGLSIVHVTVANLVRFFDWELPSNYNLDLSGSIGIGNSKATRLFAIPTPRLVM